MKKELLLLCCGAFLATAALSCGGGDKTKELMETTINLMTEQQITEARLTPDVIWKMRRVGGVQVFGNTVAYSLTDYNVAENRGWSSIWLDSVEGGDARQITASEYNAGSVAWSADGSKIYFISAHSGDAQLWQIDVKSKNGAVKQVSFIDGGIDGYGVSPDESQVFYTKKVAVVGRESSKIYEDLDKSKALIYDDLMVRHWDYWDRGEYSHIFIAPMVGGRVSEGVDIMEGEAWDAPMAPYFDISEIAWSNGGKTLAYSCKKMVGAEYALSTNSDIFIYDLETKSTKNITEGMMGYEKHPVFSPNDQKIAFSSMRRAGNESDKSRLFIYDFNSNKYTDLTAAFDYNATDIVWVGEDAVMFIAPIKATHQICRVELGGAVEVLTYGDHDITSFSKSGDAVVATMTKLSMATELVAVELGNGAIKQISQVNKHIYDNIKLGEVQKRWVRTTDGKQMLTWVVLPPDFDPNIKYPTLLYCQGGPQSTVSQFWSYRWNLQLMAAQGYVVVAPNRRGVPSFGQEWLDQISGDYSGQNIRDYLSAIDDVAKESWVDQDRLGCVGASYGGYSAFYLAGNHNGRFSAFIAHCGIFNLESMYGSTEELFFVNNDLGGSYWSQNPTAMRSYKNSPHKFVDKWDQPILIYVGKSDYRIPYTQSLEAFTAAKLRGLDARLVVFEDEAHQVFKPQNSLAWNREFFGFLDKYVKNLK